MKYSYPKGEFVWVRYNEEGGNLRYITTSKQSRDLYFLYELRDGKFVKIGKHKDPQELERKYIKI